MAKKKSARKMWWQGLDEGEVREAFDEATVDCYGDEVLTGLIEMATQELATPFSGHVLGQAVQVVDSVPSIVNPNDLDFICEIDGQRHSIAARSVQLTKPLPEGHLFLAALLDSQASM